MLIDKNITSRQREGCGVGYLDKHVREPSLRHLRRDLKEGRKGAFIWQGPGARQVQSRGAESPAWLEKGQEATAPGAA